MSEKAWAITYRHKPTENYGVLRIYRSKYRADEDYGLLLVQANEQYAYEIEEADVF